MNSWDNGPAAEYSRPAIWDVLERGGKPYIPLAWQAKYIHAPRQARIIAACGRRSGKSSAMKAVIADEEIRPPEEVLGVEHSALTYVIGPTAETAMKVWQPVWDLFVPPDSGTYVPPLGFLHQSHDKNRGFIQLINGAEIYRKTADDPRSLQGDRVTLAIVDEAHEIEDTAWENLMPSLADSGGRLFAIGIPKGKKRFRSYWELGQGKDPEFFSFSVPTYANPLFGMQARKAGFTDPLGGEHDVIAWLRQQFAADLTDDEFKRQYLAEWIEQDGQVFRNLDNVFTSRGGIPRPGMNLVMGLDVGKLHDFTVAYIGDTLTGRFIAGDRFNGLDYTLAVPRIAKMYRAFHCGYIHMDANGVGEPVADMLKREGCAIIPFEPWTNEHKNELIGTMVREVERGNVEFLAADTVLRREMELFEATVSGTTVKYSAPRGYYDDCVIAAALLVEKMSKRHRYALAGNRKSYVDFGSMGGKSYMPPLPAVGRLS